MKRKTPNPVPVPDTKDWPPTTVETWLDVPTPDGNLRVDLDDPQGFAYALRHHVMEDIAGDWPGSPVDPKHMRWASIIFRWAAGKTTESDKTYLARACREANDG